MLIHVQHAIGAMRSIVKTKSNHKQLDHVAICLRKYDATPLKIRRVGGCVCLVSTCYTADNIFPVEHGVSPAATLRRDDAAGFVLHQVCRMPWSCVFRCQGFGHIFFEGAYWWGIDGLVIVCCYVELKI